MVKFDFATAGRIVFGSGRVRELEELVRDAGRRAALVTGSRPQRARPAVEALERAGKEVSLFPVSGEPDTDGVMEAARRARDEGCDFVVAFGGGSALDAGKALAALLTNRRDLFTYLEVVGRGEPLDAPPAPFFAVPTTAGTGSEVTRNAVLRVPEAGVKVSLRHPGLLPRAAVVDPELLLSLPPRATAASGVDALVQLLEAFVSRRANPLTDAFCREGLPRSGRWLPRAFADGSDLRAREETALAALLSGLALANGGLGAVHGFAGPVGGRFDIPHGLVCAVLLRPVCRVNLRALRERDPENPALERYRDAAALLTGRPEAGEEELLDWIGDLLRRLEIPSFRELGADPAEFPDLAERAARAGSMKGNPVELTFEERMEILRSAYEAE